MSRAIILPGGAVDVAMVILPRGFQQVSFRRPRRGWICLTRDAKPKVSLTEKEISVRAGETGAGAAGRVTGLSRPPNRLHHQNLGSDERDVARL